jgi:DNA-binding response OmpR family regulator
VISAFEAGTDLADLFRTFRAVAHPSPVIAVADTEEPPHMREALAQGASDFLLPPFRATDVLLRIGRLLAQTKQEDISIRSPIRKCETLRTGMYL